jgi:hypothetical protein
VVAGTLSNQTPDGRLQQELQSLHSRVDNLESMAENYESIVENLQSRLATLESTAMQLGSIRLSTMATSSVYEGFSREVGFQTLTLEPGEFITDAMDQSAQRNADDLNTEPFEWSNKPESQQADAYMKHIMDLVPNRANAPQHVVIDSNCHSLSTKGELPGVSRPIGCRPGNVLIASAHANAACLLSQVYLCFELEKPVKGVPITSLCAYLCVSLCLCMCLCSCVCL